MKKLSEEIKDKVWQMSMDKITQKQIAKELNIGLSSVTKILTLK